MEEATRALLLATPAILYCAVAPAWEGTNPALAAFLAALLAAGHLDMMSHHPNVAEFLAAKQIQYKHDSGRYPMYFGVEQELRQNLFPNRRKRSSATDELVVKLDGWASSSLLPPKDKYYLALIDEKTVKMAVRRALESRSQEAVTFSMFQPHLAKTSMGGSALAAGYVRRQISSSYLGHYMDEGGGDIATGIQGFEPFDDNARLFPLHDVELHWRIYRQVGLHGLSWGRPEALWEEFLKVRGGFLHRALATEMRVLLAGCYGTVPPELIAPAAQRYRVQESLARALQSRKAPLALPKTLDDLLMRAFVLVQAAVQDGQQMPGFAVEAARMRDALMTQKESVLVVTAAAVEIDAAIGIAGSQVVRRPIGDHTYYDLGEVGGCHVHAVKCNTGSSGMGGSQETVRDAIEALNPSAVILAGIAFGMKKDKHNMCDVLISRELIEYEVARVSTDQGNPKLIPRGRRTEVRPRILDRFESGIRDWKDSNVHVGPIFSGEKLVDSPDFIKYLSEIAPDAIGGEMEGAGLYAAAQKKRIDWIVVKAICDWGMGKTDDYQKPAAANALRYVFHVLSHGGLAIGVAR